MNLLNESLWGDEAFSALAVMKSFPEMIGVVMRDTAPPLFYIIGYLWVRLFGTGEVALRLLILLLMAGAAVFAGLMVRRIEKDNLKAVLAGGLTILAPFLFRFAFEWRMYALLTFTVTASTYFFVAKKWGWYAVLALAALYTHHFAIFTVFAQGLWFLVSDFSWKKRGRWLVELKPFLIIGLGYSLWLYPMYLQVQRVKGGGFWLGTPSFGDLIGMVAKFVVGGVNGVWRWPVAALAAGLLFSKDWKRIWRKWLGLLIIFAAPIVLSFLVSQVLTPIFYDRYLLSAVAGVAVLLVLGTKKKFVWLAGALLLIYGYLATKAFMMTVKRPFRELAAQIKAQFRPGDYLINWNGKAHHLWESKYYGVPGPIYAPNGPLPLYVGTALMQEGDTITRLPEISGRLGVITSEEPGEIKLPGYKINSVAQFGELRFIWMTKAGR